MFFNYFLKTSLRKKKDLNNLTFHINTLNREEYTNQKANRKKKIINITTEMNEKENRKTIEKFSDTKEWFLKNSIK